MDQHVLDEHLERIARDGYTVVTDAVPTSLCDELRAALDRLEAELGIGPGTNGFEGYATHRVYNLLAHGEIYAQIPTWSEVLPIVDGVLGPGCLVSSLSSIAIGPGERAQPIHADDQVIPLAKPHVPTVCNSMWALTDFTEENGATRIVPGTHLLDHSPEYGTHYDSVPAEMEKGSVLVWHGSLWHGGGENRTTERRVGIAMNYCAGWIRQQENQQLGVPLATIASFGPRLRELCGFGTYHGLIGHIDRRTPDEVLLGEAGGEMVWARDQRPPES
jgi:ectoine hydroxylase-related dioxygenase (phytanoyl-CoA dioxygenase family)